MVLRPGVAVIGVGKMTLSVDYAVPKFKFSVFVKYTFGY